jgi:hypothetical protein
MSAGVDLVEIGADRPLDRIDEAAQDAVLVEALNLPQRGLDRAPCVRRRKYRDADRSAR